MTFTRAVFVFAFAMLALGLVGSRALAAYLFPGLQGPPSSRIVAIVNTSTSRPATKRTAIPTRTLAPTVGPHRAPTTPPTPSPTRTSPSPTSTRAPRVKATPTATASATPTVIATATATPTPTIGIVTLARYWIATQQARTGQTIEIGYVIDNETGRAAHVLLGASLKSTRALSWASASIDDPPHDVVAVVPPGISTHVRFFTLPSDIHRGAYDVAWGLRDTTTGERDALVTAADALRVAR